ncbi:MAG: ABC transporter ATP-binding protein [Syntrophobacteraceae bacterium]|jgi:branched-chain amino acid transport system ATP-binding protein
MILQVNEINTYYGMSHILQNVSFEVGTGEVVALLGRNGVGKTTALRSVMGISPARSGVIRFQGENVRGIPPYALAQRGVSYVPDDMRIFPDLTCEENLEIVRRVCRRKGYWNRERVEKLFPVLKDRRQQKGFSLSGGERKMLSLGRALMSNPVLILLDEPSEGLAPLVMRTLVATIQEIRRHNVAILLADQNLKFCRQLCDRGYIIEKGRIVHQGGMEAIWTDEAVVKRYLAI